MITPLKRIVTQVPQAAVNTLADKLNLKAQEVALIGKGPTR